MIKIERGIKVKDFIEILKPFENMNITFAKKTYNDIKIGNCFCEIDLVGNAKNSKLEVGIK